MVFSSVIFVSVFLPIVLLAHYLLYLYLKSNRSHSIANIFIFGASILFYTWGEYLHVLILLFSTLCNFFFARFIDSSKSIGKRKFFLTAGVIVNILLLMYYKYCGFFLEILKIANIDIWFPKVWNINALKNVALPIGISFYTFQGLSYIIDVYRKDVSASSSLTDFSCYFTMFSQLIAGPIVRYKNIKTELTKRIITIEGLANGATRFIYGLAKKILLADTLGRVADAAFKVPAGELPASAAWLGIVCYSFQIYYDFSGYSDMAIGIGRMIGFTFPENFNYPYISRSIQEFWRRWHITLSEWFRDYLYIPLGGNRKRKYCTAFNLVIVFALCGIWHGAAIGFFVWGLYHGFFLSIERIFPNFTIRLPRLLQHTYTLVVVMMGWVFFRTEHLSAAAAYFKALVGITPIQSFAVNEVWFQLNGYALPLSITVALILSAPIYSYVHKKSYKFIFNTSLASASFLIIAQKIWILALFFLCLMPMFGTTYSAFIYFRF
jgi:alginate O-acetyltransferase complex protein AlgI